MKPMLDLLSRRALAKGLGQQGRRGLKRLLAWMDAGKPLRLDGSVVKGGVG